MRIIASLTLSLALLVGVAAFAPAEPVNACGGNASTFFGLPDWHQYLDCGADGGVDNTTLELSQIWLIALAVFEAILRVGGFATMIFILWGGVKYITSQGNSDATATARKTIINAAAGLVILVSASILVTFLINLLDVGTTSGSTDGQLLIPSGDASSATISNILTLVYAIVAALAVIMIIIGSIKFATSTGDSSKTVSARNTIIYAVVGLVIVLVAQIITTTVLDRVGLIPWRFS